MNSLSGRSVTRAAALSVAPVLNGRNKLCAIATLPVVQLNERNVVQRNPLFMQIDPDVANVVTFAQTIEDLIFEAVAWWEIIAADPLGYPTSARRRDPSSVSLTPPTDRSLAPLPSGWDPRGASVWIDGREVPAARVIRFDSPNPGLLTGGGAKAIRRWLLLDAAASMYATDPRPGDYFTPAENADDIADTEVTKILAQWRAARRKRATGWVPSSLKYNTVDSPTPQQMQLVELQKQATLDIANAMGLDPEELGVSTTSRTYANAVDRRRDRLNDVLAPYMRAVTDRLSMPDVTHQWDRVIFDLDDYMKSNPTEQLAVHKGYKDMGVLLPEEIRHDIGRPPLPKQPKPAPAPDPVAEAEAIAREAAGGQDPEETMNNSRTTLQFTAAATETRPGAVTGTRVMQLDAVAVDFRVEKETRTVWGLAIPYGQIVSKYGMKFRFMAGSIEWTTPVSRVKFLIDHMDAVGYALNLTQKKAGVEGKYKLGRSQAATDVLMDAEDGVYDGLSAGVEFDLDKDALYNSTDECWDIYRATMSETSITAMPAFDDARITRVVATQERGTSMEDCAVCGTRHAPGAACASRPQPNTPPANVPADQNTAPAPALQLSAEQLHALVAQPGVLAALAGIPAPQQPAPQPAGFTLTAEQIGALAQQGHLQALLGIGVPAQQAQQPEPRPVVNPGRPVAMTATTEEAPYRFDRHGNLHRGKFDFSTDVIQGLVHGDHQGLKRAETFMADYFKRVEQSRMGSVSAQFVSQADAATLNPNVQRPDLYVDQKDFEYPIWNAINKGTIDDATPFVLPKFSSSSGLVGAHTENVEPTAGTFVATSQTITPTPVSGKVLIGREAWDQGGNPQLSALIWNQMVRGWYEALEASAVTMLEALAPTTLTITTAAADSVLEASLTNQLAPLQFVRGGFRMRDFFIQVDLYKALVAAKDGNGRKLFPVLGATNATGTTAEFFSALMVAGLVGRPAWALAATSANSANSFLFDRADVSGWATPPQRLTFENISIAQIHLGIWGYKALANTDLTGVRKVAYDPV
jgi:phage head maturation protease